jgi:hypothetical protein
MSSTPWKRSNPFVLPYRDNDMSGPAMGEGGHDSPIKATAAWLLKGLQRLIDSSTSMRTLMNRHAFIEVVFVS